LALDWSHEFEVISTMRIVFSPSVYESQVVTVQVVEANSVEGKGFATQDVFQSAGAGNT
jgi:hypothetical protein